MAKIVRGRSGIDSSRIIVMRDGETPHVIG